MPWTTITTNCELTAIHAALLPTEPDGVILYYGDWAADGAIGVQELSFSRLYRFAPGLADPIESFGDGDLPTTDCFCAGQSFLSDGRLLSGGGTFGWQQPHGPFHDHYAGERRCWMYLPRARRWVEVDEMNYQPDGLPKGGGRWYPTLVTLGSGEVIAIGGHPRVEDFYPPHEDTRRHNNNTAERYSPGSDKWTLLTADVTAQAHIETDGYPRFHLLPSGLLFSDTEGKGGSKRIFDPGAGVWTGPDVGGLELVGGDAHRRGSAASSVLLPLLPPEYKPRILVTNSPDPTAFRIDVDSSPVWEKTSPRQGSAAGRDRENACATLLPTGQVLVTGGWPGASQASDFATATQVPELYTPGIDWSAGDFSDTANERWETIEDPAPTPRGYHSGALLLPDGRVWHGGSTTTAGGANRNFELFEPAYVGVAGRPTITDCPPNIGYLMPFYVETPNAGSIARVALMRCGSITHGFDADQRYVGLQFGVWSPGALEIHAPPDPNIAPPGYYMLFLIDDQGRVCERASFIRLSRQKLVISAEISTYSIFEVDALGPPSKFEKALFIVFDGFMPHEVATPSYRFFLPNGDDVPDVDVTIGGPSFEAGSDKPDVAQRIAYPVTLRFTSLKAFDEIPENDDFLTVTFSATAGLFQAETKLDLSRNQNPRMQDGEPPYLSTDVRVFKTNPGLSPIAGIEHPDAGAENAYAYIRQVINTLNDPENADSGAQFEGLSLYQESSRLELGVNDANGNPAFNYALARVRFVAPEGIKAADVRVFFRMWTTGWSAVEFDPSASYRRAGSGPDAAPLLGLQGGEIGNIPCFAQTRNPNMAAQEDGTNRFTLNGAGSEEVFGYFGCWLDVNQDIARFPLKPQSDGPFDDGDDPQGLRTIQELMRGLHQCLVAEIHYTLDPIPPLATPGSSDNLSQRNILFDQSDNPGGFAAHIVHHTFELEPSPVSFEDSVLAPRRHLSEARRLHPDELVIDWGGLPRESLVTFYMPQVDAREIVRAGAARQTPGNLSAPAADTIRCKVTDIGFIPIPGPLSQTIACLMSVQLPPGVPYGKSYRVVVRQVSGRGLKVLGTTEFRIEVGDGAELLPRFLHNLAVLKHIALSIPQDNRWHPVFKRYVGELEDRVRAFGGDPGAVRPNPHGTGKILDRPDRERKPALCVTGDVVQLHYGCCGRFEGFTLRDCDHREWRFDCVSDCFEAVLLTAMRERFRATIHARRGERRDLALNRSCPWSGRPVRADALARYRGRIVGFCSPDHRDRFEKALAGSEPAGETDRRPVERSAETAPPPPPAESHRHEQAQSTAAQASRPAGQPARAEPGTRQRLTTPAGARDRGEHGAAMSYRENSALIARARDRDEIAAAIRLFDEAIACGDRCDGRELKIETIKLHR